jgi:hypothetical protein
MDFVMMRSSLAQAPDGSPKFDCAGFDCYYKIKKLEGMERKQGETGDWEMAPELCESC